jgi:hypothetical protein
MNTEKKNGKFNTSQLSVFANIFQIYCNNNNTISIKNEEIVSRSGLQTRTAVTVYNNGSIYFWSAFVKQKRRLLELELIQ